MRILVAIACVGCGGFRFGAGPTITTDGAIGVQATATLVLGGTAIGIGGGAGARVDRDTIAASAVGTVDVTLSNGKADHDTFAAPTRLTRFAVRLGSARVRRDGTNEDIGVFGFGVAHLKVLRATRTCVLFGDEDRVGLGAEATVNVERRSTGAVGVIGVGVTLQLDAGLNLRKCD